MKNWEKICIDGKTSIYDVISLIDRYASQIAVVVDEKRRLRGTITDGDVRRAIIKKTPLEAKAEDIMNADPSWVAYDKEPEEVFNIMRTRKLRHLPAVDTQGVVRNVHSLRELLDIKTQDNWVVIMAGGLGKRLAPLTENCPKPMLMVGDKPILERIIESFVEQGFKNFFISVNYMHKLIQDYFGDGSRWGVNLQYLLESKRLGTAGALSLLPERPSLPILIMNGDLLTKVNFNHLLDYHSENSCAATVCLCEYNFEVPYGVVQVDDGNVKGILEKPVTKYFINAGIYCLEPDCLDYVPRDEYFEMTTLCEKILEEKQALCSFPIREYWLDIGRHSDLEKANMDLKCKNP